MAPDLRCHVLQLERGIDRVDVNGPGRVNKTLFADQPEQPWDCGLLVPSGSAEEPCCPRGPGPAPRNGPCQWGLSANSESDSCLLTYTRVCIREGD